jgi:putative membrane protein
MVAETLHELAEEVLPAVNATLNGTSATLLLCGWLAARARRLVLHRRLIVAAMTCSALFLVCYVVRMSLTGTHRFEGPEWMRAVYLTVLTSHMALAIVTVPLVGRTAWLGAHGRFVEHRRIARWTFPIWMYVSVTGVVIYVMLYRM